MPSAHRHVFISYARADGRERASELRAELGARGFNLWQDVIAMKAGEKWWQQIMESIDRSAVMVLLLTKSALSSQAVRDEFNYARKVGTPVIPVVFDVAVIRRAPEWLAALDVVLLDTADPGYELARHRFFNQLSDPPARRPRPFAAPNLPSEFVPRPAKVEQLSSSLLGEDGGISVPAVTVVTGAGGFGKTTMAAAICRDERIRSAYDDGVLWLQFRPQVTATDVLILLNDQIAILDPDGPVFNDVTQASARFRDLISERQVLVVLDDVWSETYLHYFVHPGTAYLITTRSEVVASRASGNRVSIQELAPNEATALLRRWIAQPLSTQEEATITELSAALGHWALLLELVGAEVRSLIASGRSASHAMNHVQLRLNRRGYTYLDRQDGDNRNAAIAESLNASLRTLPDTHRRRFEELGVFPGDVVLPFATIGQLWRATGGYDDIDTEDALEALSRLALFTYYDPGKSQLRLHNIVHQVVAARLTSAATIHEQLLAAWGDLYALPDQYAWRFVGHHLRASNAGDHMRRLLFDFRWVHAKLSATDLLALVADYSVYPNDDDCDLLRSVLMMSANAIADPAQLATQLVGRLKRLVSTGGRLANLVNEASSWDERAALLPVRVDLPSVDVGVHRTLLAAAPILSSALTEENRRLVTGLADGRVQVWNWQTGELVTEFRCAVGPIFSLSVQDDLMAVGGYGDHWVRYKGAEAPIEVWNWRKPERIQSLGNDIADIAEGYAVTLDQGLAAITTGAMNCKVHVFDWPLGKLVNVFDGDPSGLSGNKPASIRFVNGYFLYHERSGVMIHITRTLDWEYLGEITGDVGFDAAPFCLGEKLVVKSKWRCELEHEHFYCEFDEKEDAAPTINVARYHPPVVTIATDGDHLLACSDIIEYRDLTTGAVVRTLEGHTASISAVHIAADAIVTTSRDHTIRIWNGARNERRSATTTRESLPTNERFYRPAIHCLQREKESVFVGTHGGSLQEWNWTSGALVAEVRTGEPIRTLAVNENWLAYSHFETTKHASFEVRQRIGLQPKSGAPSKNTAAFTVEGGIYDFRHRGVTRVKLCKSRCAVVLENYYTPANSFGHLGFTGNRIELLDLNEQERILAVGEWISSVGLTDDFVAGGTLEGGIEIWETATGRPVVRFQAHQGPILDILFHRNLVFTCSADDTVCIWDAAKDYSLRQRIRHTGDVYSMRVYGGLLLTVSEDHTLAIHDWNTGATLARFSDDAALLDCDWDAESGVVIAGGMSGRLHILRANAKLQKAGR
jgi:WD40 repeat protein